MVVQYYVSSFTPILNPYTVVHSVFSLSIAKAHSYLHKPSIVQTFENFEVSAYSSLYAWGNRGTAAIP